MAVKADIEDGKQIDISVLVTRIDEWNHDVIARKIELEDINREPLELTVFHNNAIEGFQWEVGRWYLLENAVGNEFRGEMQLNPSYDLTVTPLDAPPAAAEDDESADIDTEAGSVRQSGGTTSTGGAPTSSDASEETRFVPVSEVEGD